MNEASGTERSPAHKISTDAVQVLRKYTGRGPTKARTTIGDQTVTILMADTLTHGERQLADSGHEDSVLRTRQEFQNMMQEDLVSVVEQHTERKVTAFMSANHIDPDYGVEVFVLEPTDAA